MSKIAIDVVLLPERKMIDEVVEINKKLLKKYRKKIVLGTRVNLPHISLCMGAVEEIEVPRIIEFLEELSAQYRPFTFNGKLSLQGASDKENTLWIEIEKDDAIQELQGHIMKNLWSFLSYDIDEYMFADAHEIEDKTVFYVKHYSELYENPSLFKPHITLGVGLLDEKDKVYSFSSSVLALFKVGNHCTCRELIYKTDLNSEYS